MYNNFPGGRDDDAAAGRGGGGAGRAPVRRGRLRRTVAAQHGMDDWILLKKVLLLYFVNDFE